MPDHQNIAIHLPTGYGKTLVGLEIAEFRRSELREKPVWLCPTRQLVFQVLERARELGIPAFGFVGNFWGADSTQRREYNLWQVGNATAVTVYERVFSRTVQADHPDAASSMTFDQATFAVLDDVHAAEQAVSAYWTLSLPRFLQLYTRGNPPKRLGEPFKNPAYFELLRGVNGFLPGRLRDEYDLLHKDQYEGEERLPYEGAPVYCIPFPIVADRVELIKGAISKWLRWKNLRGLQADFPDYVKECYDPLYFQRQVWDNLKDQLYFCHVLISRGSIAVRPYLCPVGEHPVWRNIKNRLFMSATMRVDGEVQKLFGTESIHHLTQSVDVVAATGRRLLLSVDTEATGASSHLNEALTGVDRLVCITPSEEAWKDLSKRTPSLLKRSAFNADDTERSRDAFLEANEAVLTYYQRYEGLDVPNDQCRVVLLNGLPDGLNPMEKLLTYELGCQDLIANRIASRLEQGFGRCNRQPADFSVVLTDSDTYNWVLNSQELISSFALSEIRFSLRVLGTADMPEIVRRFVQDDGYRLQLVRLYDEEVSGGQRNVSVGHAAPKESGWRSEVRFSASSWKREWKVAAAEAFEVATTLREAALKARDHDARQSKRLWALSAWWFYLSGIAAACRDRRPKAAFDYSTALSHWGQASDCIEESGLDDERLEWWRSLITTTRQVGEAVIVEAKETSLASVDALDSDCLKRQASVLVSVLSSKDFLVRIAELESLLQVEVVAGVTPEAASRQFERGLTLLGSWLGFEIRQPVAKGADGVWVSRPGDAPEEHVVIILEAKSSEKGGPTNPVSRESLQQLDAWLKLESSALGLVGKESVFLVRIGRQALVVAADTPTPERNMRTAYADGKSILVLEEIRSFADRVIATVREVYALCMKQASLQTDTEILKRCLLLLGRRHESLPSDFVRLLRNRTYRA